MKYADFQFMATAAFHALCEGQPTAMPDLLLPAKHNERVRKAVAMYLLTDQDEFKKLVRSAREDDFAHQLLVDLHAAFNLLSYDVASDVRARFFNRREVMLIVARKHPSDMAQEMSKYFTSLMRDYQLRNNQSAELNRLVQTRFDAIPSTSFSKRVKVR
ncbi:hypothetical protein [Cohnella sp.]|uniref:hypothetical protein n=1 Tax=Cohnella sp. TaxID=1883426 RepID=UPI003566E4D0